MKAEDTLSALYRQYIVMVRKRAAELLLGDTAAAEDVAHEVFIKFMHYRAKHPIDGSPAALLYCITHRTCIDRMRATYRHNLSLDHMDVHGQGEGHIEDRVAAEQAMSQAVKGMQEEEIRIGAAFYLDELDVAGIADSLKVSERTVSRRLNSFRSHVRRILDGRRA